jgi:hypothetical protein
VIMTFKNSVTIEELDGDSVLRSAHASFPFLRSFVDASTSTCVVVAKLRVQGVCGSTCATSFVVSTVARRRVLAS